MLLNNKDGQSEGTKEGQIFNYPLSIINYQLLIVNC